MSNIVITHFSSIFYNDSYQSSCFYDGLITSLREYGHNVMQVITSDFAIYVWDPDNKVISEEIRKNAINEIKKFNPDLVLSFNNCSIEGLEDELNCPIALLDADSWLYFNCKDTIKQKLDRYYFIAFSQYGKEDYFRNLSSLTKNKVIVMPPATAVQSTSLKKVYNISFIGSPFFNQPNLLEFLNKNKWIIDSSTDEIINKLSSLESTLQKHDIKLSEILHCRSGPNRTRIILNLLDLGITIFGPAAWKDLGAVDINVIKAYKDDVVFSLEQNQNIYNSSLISLNIKHTQTVTGYPWRVPDILASSSVLLTDHSKDLIQNIGKEVNLQIYQSPYEARTLASKLLHDEVLRKEIVLQQNEVVERKYRWHHRFPLIQQLTGVNLERSSTEVGKYHRLEVKHRWTKLIEPLLYKYICASQEKLKKTRKKKSQYLHPIIQYHLMRAWHKYKANN